jgi:hypothetical protein
MKRFFGYLLPAVLGLTLAMPAFAARSADDQARYGLSCSPAETLEPADWAIVPLKGEALDWASVGAADLLCISAPPGQTARIRGFSHSSKRDYTDLMLYTDHGQRKLFMAYVHRDGSLDLQPVAITADAGR